MIAIIDYGMGNLRSVQRKFDKLGEENVVTSDVEIIMKADKLVLPGVGHFAEGMKNLTNRGLIDVLNTKVIVNQTPILGICLGMQLLSEFSEEGGCKGLGLINAKTVLFKFDEFIKPLKIPHMGWNSIVIEKNSPLMNGIANDEMFYFVHSYHVVCQNNEDILCSNTYGITFTSAIQHGNIFGTQFHPEKSHDAGIQLLKNFCEF